MIKRIQLSASKQEITGNYSPGETVLAVCDASGSALSIKMPDARTVDDCTFHFKKTDSSANMVTITTRNSQTIDGAATQSLTLQYDSITILSDRSNFKVLNSGYQGNTSHHRHSILYNPALDTALINTDNDKNINLGKTVHIDYDCDLATKLTGLTNTTVVVSANVTISANITFATGVKFRFQAGGKITIGAGVDVVNLEIENDPMHQIISCSLVDTPTLVNSMVRPEWFGAVADRFTNDALPCQKAVNSTSKNSTIILSQSYVSTGIDISGKSNLRITGGGELVLSGTYSEPSPTAGYAFQLIGTIDNLEIDHLTIQGDGIAASRHQGIFNFSGQTISNVRFHDISFYDLGLGISLNAAAGGTYTKGFVYNNYLYNILSTTVGSYGIHLAECTYCHVYGNTIEKSQRHAIYQAQGNGYNVISGNIIKDHRLGVADGALRAAIVVSRSQNIIVSGNTILDSWDAGMEIGHDTSSGKYCKDILVSGNKFINRKNNGPHLFVGEQLVPGTYDTTHIKIFGNSFFTDHSGGVGGSDISLLNGQYVSISDNQFAKIGVAAGSSFIDFGADLLINNAADCQYNEIKRNRFIATGSDTSLVKGIDVCLELADSTNGAHNEIVDNVFVGCGYGNVFLSLPQTNSFLLIDTAINIVLGTYTEGDATPSVFGMNQINISNSSLVTITDFDDGINGQEITLYFSDSNTTVSNSMYLKDSLAWTPSAHDILKMRYNGTAWHEVSRSYNASTIAINTLTRDPKWYLFTKEYAHFSADNTTNSIALFTLPAGGCIQAVVIHHTTAFSGGSISAYIISVGIAGEVNRYASAFDVFSTTAPANLQNSSGFSFENLSEDTDVIATATSTGGNLSVAVAGSVNIYILMSRTPDVTTV